METKEGSSLQKKVTSDDRTKLGFENLHIIQSHSAGEIRDVSMNKDFNLWSTLGVSFSFVATPLSIGTYLAFSLSAGGSPYFFYGYVAAFVGNTIVALSLAEMAAFLPHSSGQIFWTLELAPMGIARSLSYFDGAFTMMAWLFWTAGTYLFGAQLVLAFIEICGATFIQEHYHTFLTYVALLMLAVVMNTWAFKAMPALSKFMIGYINLGSLFILIVLVARTQPKQSAKVVFVDIVNATGWSSDGLVFLLCLLPGVTAINGFDAAAHLADELPNPARQIPQVMIGTVLLCGLSGLPMVLVFLFCITKPENLLTATQPVFQLFRDSLNSESLTIISCSIYIGLYAFAGGSILMTLSRCWWAFAGCGAMPFWRWQSSLSRAWLLPINAVVVVGTFSLLLGLLIFGPSTVLVGLVGSGAICFYASYSIPIVCFLIRGRKDVPQHRYFNLGRMGPVLNVIAVMWGCLVSVFLCFPTTIPVSASSMNYASAVVAVGLIGWVLNWVLYARTHYRSPVILRTS